MRIFRRKLLPGFVAGIFAILGFHVVLAQAPAFKSAGDAPIEWRKFSEKLQSGFEVALRGKSPENARLWRSLYFETKPLSPDQINIVVNAWVDGNGNVSRVSFASLGNPEADAALTLVLTSAGVGQPPIDLIQPVRVRLSLRARP